MAWREPSNPHTHFKEHNWLHFLSFLFCVALNTTLAIFFVLFCPVRKVFPALFFLGITLYLLIVNLLYNIHETILSITWSVKIHLSLVARPTRLFIEIILICILSTPRCSNHDHRPSASTTHQEFEIALPVQVKWHWFLFHRQRIATLQSRDLPEESRDAAERD